LTETADNLETVEFRDRTALLAKSRGCLKKMEELCPKLGRANTSFLSDKYWTSCANHTVPLEDEKLFEKLDASTAYRFRLRLYGNSTETAQGHGNDTETLLISTDWTIFKAIATLVPYAQRKH